ncbi:MAG: hypothetical protein IKD50_11275, partial [Clostridia bacterium]|nr:hypothetical protein [Clostridia bacterium]
MTIPELIETLCSVIGELAALTDYLAMRLLQTGTMTEGEAERVREIQKHIEGIGISPPEQSNKEDGAGQI